MDKVKTLTIEISLLIIIPLTLAVFNIPDRWTLSIVLTLYAVLAHFMLKKRQIVSTNKKQVILLMLIMGIIYLGIYYLLGIVFGFFKASVTFSFMTLIYYILPNAIIIISSEIIRYILNSQKAKTTKALTFIILVAIDMFMYATNYNLSSLSDFMIVLGFVFFSSVAGNLLYNYISVRFGYKPNILYRLITTVYIFVIPYIPDVYEFFSSILRMVYPYLIYLLIERMYFKTVRSVGYSEIRKNRIETGVVIIIVSLITMLISCKFKYGAIVVGSGSMTGTVNKGDIVVFETYKKQNIDLGQIIIFKSNNLKIVHRVINIEKHNGLVRYYTKGDANSTSDDNYLISDDIVGLVKFKISYIGWPSIWLKDLFE